MTNNFFRVAVYTLLFGIKFWMICDANTYYVLQAFPYTRKTNRTEERLGDYVVTKLMKHYFNTGLNVTTGKFFTKLSTAKKLKKHQNNYGWRFTPK